MKRRTLDSPLRFDVTKRLRQPNEKDSQEEPRTVGQNVGPLTVQTDSSELCKRCAGIKPSEYLDSLENAEEPRLVADLGILASPKSNSCAGCRFFSSVTGPNGSNNKPCGLYACRILESNVWGMEGSILVTAPVDSDKIFDHNVESSGTIALAEPAGPVGLVKGSSIDPNSINFAMLKDCISSCLQCHAKCNRSASKPRELTNVTLIDCWSRELVPYYQSYKFVALSYVWGKGFADDQPEDGQLPDNLMQTIEDAMAATKKLGYDYIWIDRYCINQENNVEKQHQLRQMSAIYRCAEVTLVAIAGDDPTYGLPGVSSTRRTSQPSATFNGVRFVSTLPHPNTAIGQSKWNHRGWTYQEDHFSIRKIYFLEGQVYFTCYSGGAIETISHLDNNGVPYAMKAGDPGDEEAFEVLDHLGRYSGRQLTHKRDAIDAITGIFNDDTAKHGVAPSFLGIPLVLFSELKRFRDKQRRRKTDAFLLGLGWQNRRPGSRRNIWPSWTWAEWNVEFTYDLGSRDNLADPFTLTTDAVTRPQAFIERRGQFRLDLEDKDVVNLLKKPLPAATGLIQIVLWTLALDISPVNRSDRDPFANYWLALPDKFQYNHTEPVDGFLASLKHEDADLKVPFWPMDVNFGMEALSAAETVSPGGGGILGVIVARRSNSGGTVWSLVVLVVQKKGDHYERIGHCSITCDQMRDLARRCGEAEKVEEGWVFGWSQYDQTTKKVCERYLSWKRLRLG